MAILFDDGVIRVVIRRHNERGSPPRGTMVTFADLTFRPQDEKLWGEGPAKALGYDLIGVIAHNENWFPRASMEKALIAFRRRLRPHAIGYGYSMGGYGILKYGKMIGLERVLAVCPQYSIDPRDVPGDRRFTEHFQPNLHRGMALTREDLPDFAVQLADPYFREDAINSNAIEALGGSHWIRSPFTGHASIWLLTDSAFLEKLFERLGEADAPGMRQLMRQRRGETPHWFRNIGRAAMMRGQEERALRFWQRGLELGLVPRFRDDDMAECLPVLIHSRFERGEKERAFQAIDTVAPHIANNATALEHTGHALAAGGEWARAEVQFRAAVAANPKSGGAWRGVLASLRIQGRTAEHLEAALEASAALPEEPEIVTETARLLERAGRAAEAEPLLRNAIAARPDAPMLLRAMASTLTALGREDEAAEHLRDAERRRPNDPAIAHDMGNLLLRRGEMGQAVEHYREASRRHPLEAKLHLGLSKALAAAGDGSGALEAAREAVRLNPKNGPARLWLLRCLAMRGRLLEVARMAPSFLRRKRS
ncbi:tetratricopeptide repeat protein [Acetobacteraceae bacterium H6797]|nr:tetratricopeptide repeat protein [Acetobacteraceae bacterium H6797]